MALEFYEQERLKLPETLGPIEQTLKDNSEVLSSAKEAAKADPQYAQMAFELANKLYGDDQGKKEAFLNGAELHGLIDKQIKAAEEVRALVEGPDETDKKRIYVLDDREPRHRRRLGGLMAAHVLVSQLFSSKRSKPGDAA